MNFHHIKAYFPRQAKDTHMHCIYSVLESTLWTEEYVHMYDRVPDQLSVWQSAWPTARPPARMPVIMADSQS